jgi:hypothetical protein
VRLDEILERARIEREEGARKYEESLGSDECMMCDAYGNDKRSLFIDCGYAVSEVVAEALNISDAGAERGRGYYLLLCKTCRGRLLDHLGVWGTECRAERGKPKDHDGCVHVDADPNSPVRNIPVRVNGRIQMLTREEWDERQPGRDPVTLAQDFPVGS